MVRVGVQPPKANAAAPGRDEFVAAAKVQNAARPVHMEDCRAVLWDCLRPRWMCGGGEAAAKVEDAAWPAHREDCRAVLRDWLAASASHYQPQCSTATDYAVLHTDYSSSCFRLTRGHEL